jgi:2,5-furandicarboxylate decarboxylase 1
MATPTASSAASLSGSASPGRLPPPKVPLDSSLRAYLATNADIVTRIVKPVRMDDIGALSAQSDQPILFENIVEKPGFRLCDILVKNRASQARALGVAPKDYLRTLAYRLRQPPRGFKVVKSGPVKDVVRLHNQADWTELPIPFHKDRDAAPYVTAMNILLDPETGFYNSCHAGTHAVGPRRGLISFVTPHSHVIMRKYIERGLDHMPIAFVFGVPPAFEIMANFSGLHMDMWGEMEMVGTIMDRDIEMVPCETLPINVPAEAEIIVEGRVNLKDRFKVGEVTSPSMYHLPHSESLPEVEITAITMRGDRPIYRNHQTTPATDHQPLPRLCHEAVLYNRLTEIGLDVKDVRFPTWGAALSCIIQFDYPREGFVNDALMAAMGAPWLNTKMVVAVSPDTNLDDPADVYHAIATRCDPARDIIIVPGTRGSPYDPSARPLEGHNPWRIVGKMGIDATAKARHDPADFERAWPRNWGKVRLADYL